jgi:hypothetical protein
MLTKERITFVPLSFDVLAHKIWRWKSKKQITCILSTGMDIVKLRAFLIYTLQNEQSWTMQYIGIAEQG